MKQSTWFGLELRLATEVEQLAIKWATAANQFSRHNVLDDMDSETSFTEDDVWYVDEDMCTAYISESERHSANGRWLAICEVHYEGYIHRATATVAERVRL